MSAPRAPRTMPAASGTCWGSKARLIVASCFAVAITMCLVGVRESKLQPDRKFRHLSFLGREALLVVWAGDLLLCWGVGGAAEPDRSHHSSIGRGLRRY